MLEPLFVIVGAIVALAILTVGRIVWSILTNADCPYLPPKD